MVEHDAVAVRVVVGLHRAERATAAVDGPVVGDQVGRAPAAAGRDVQRPRRVALPGRVADGDVGQRDVVGVAGPDDAVGAHVVAVEDQAVDGHVAAASTGRPASLAAEADVEGRPAAALEDDRAGRLRVDQQVPRPVDVDVHLAARRIGPRQELEGIDAGVLDDRLDLGGGRVRAELGDDRVRVGLRLVLSGSLVAPTIASWLSETSSPTSAANATTTGRAYRSLRPSVRRAPFAIVNCAPSQRHPARPTIEGAGHLLPVARMIAPGAAPCDRS